MVPLILGNPHIHTEVEAVCHECCLRLGAEVSAVANPPLAEEYHLQRLAEKGSCGPVFHNSTIGVMEKKIEATIWGLYRDYIGVIWGLYWDNGKENGSFSMITIVVSRRRRRRRFAQSNGGSTVVVVVVVVAVAEVV